MKRKQKSLRKIKLLLLLIILTTVLAITATYAWFSSQRDVEITGMKLNVEVAENMQISLDGEHWLQTITIDNMRQFYGTYSVNTTHQAKSDDNTNYVPTELKPVSTIGEVTNGKLLFMSGEAQIGTTSTSVTATPCSEDDLLVSANVQTRESQNALHPYLVFDIYLRNLSRQESDDLLLNIGSRLFVDSSTPVSQEGTGVEGTGLENSVRVAFIPYGNTANITENATVVRALTPDGTETATIWEPNDLEHTLDAVNNSKRGVVNGTTMPTYGIKYSGTAVTVNDVESTTDSLLDEQVTIKPTYTTTGGTTETANLVDINGETVKLEANKITKVRVYIWIEGQDVDCINSASYGDRLQATIRLTKPINGDGTENNTYTGGGNTTGSGNTTGGGSGSGDITGEGGTEDTQQPTMTISKYEYTGGAMEENWFMISISDDSNLSSTNTYEYCWVNNNMSLTGSEEWKTYVPGQKIYDMPFEAGLFLWVKAVTDEAGNVAVPGSDELTRVVGEASYIVKQLT